MAAVKAACSHLPDELWEFIFKFLSRRDDHHHHHHTLKALSVVSKQFLSITNRLRLSLTVINQTVPFLPRLFQRFPNLTSLNLILSSYNTYEINANCTRISTFPLYIKCLYLSKKMGCKTIPLIGFSKMYYIDKNDLCLVARCVPWREELGLSYPRISVNFSIHGTS